MTKNAKSVTWLRQKYFVVSRDSLTARYVFSLRVFIKASIQEFAYVAVFVAQKNGMKG